MRIETNQRTNSVGGHGPSGRAQGGAVFSPVGADQPSRAAASAPVMAAASLDALLALQGVDDPLQGRRKRKLLIGRTLLDTLEAVKADLLTGHVNPARLDQLVTMLAEARERCEPGLDDLLDDIDLRVRVELAKLGRYPAF